MQALPQGWVSETCSHSSQQLQMPFLGALGHQQHENIGHGPIVGRIEGQRRCQAKVSSVRRKQARDARMRQRHP